ncbi:hypothetical protein F5144DRAFT_544188 [Chaetomium tenue]|uniref:Uncharacterized protein n=1 Tax=Chaetomium tenue TaxID=1854479 RepID=A0ACB7PPV8_9PEZI|nr:hypothetical protein F5144DRAFT_544188 [Chaetomium globosum]
MSGILAKEKQETRQKMATRRAIVRDTMSRVFWRRDPEWVQKRMKLQQQATFETLFEKMGYNDPSVGVGINFIAWNIDYGIWDGLRHSPRDYEALRPIFDEVPKPTDIPYCSQFRDYQRSRLGQKAEEDPLKQAKTEGKSLKRKSDADDNTGNDDHAQPKRLRQQELKFSPSIPPQTSKSATTALTPKAQGKQPLPLDSYPGPHPSTSTNSPSTVLTRLRTLTTTSHPPPPRDPSAWPRYIWRAVYGGTSAPPRDGDFFAVRLREEWLRHVTPGVLGRVRGLLERTVRVEVRRREEPVAVGGGGAGAVVKAELVTVWLLAVAVADRAEVTSLRGLGYLAEVWGDVWEWHAAMVAGGQGEGGE